LVIVNSPSHDLSIDLREHAIMITIHQATIHDVDVLAPLFDDYRQFYGQRSDVAAARQFLLDRFRHSESIIFLARRDSAAIGFTQLYPSFSSISMARIYVLSDLFVARTARKAGAGRLLLQTAAQFGRSIGARQLTLETATTNLAAQALYDACGWTRDTEFYVYQITLAT
jgi:GNAT superfamily N-acetyltransferase